ncbi:MAG: nitrogenase component 1 [Terriglobales bacterium]|jgi:nitrogenase molybdenum-iron protein NifN
MSADTSALTNMTASLNILQKPAAPPSYVSTRNACKLCAPLGASLVFRGIEGAVPFLHGSQGCATYMRRYIISHFREPMDIAASGFSESSAIFGGGENLRRGLQNVSVQYKPSMIGIATTCLCETIGEDVAAMVREYQEAQIDLPTPQLVHVSTPSYIGTHVDGFHAAVRSVVATLATPEPEPSHHVNLFPGMVSTADIRYLKEIAEDFELSSIVLPDYSETLDGPALDAYERIPAGGTPIQGIRSAAGARASIEFGRSIRQRDTAAAFLESTFGVRAHRLGLPIGINETDRFFSTLKDIADRPVPRQHEMERGRLIDSYVDGHKYVFGKRAIVYGEEDLVVGLAALLAEIGIIPVLCASGGKSGALRQAITEIAPSSPGVTEVCDDTDFMSIGEKAKLLKPDLLIGNSKGYGIARDLGIPLVRVGFPIHDRIGGQRILHLGYRGTQQLFDRIVNALLEHKQQTAEVGYSYL